MLNNSSQIASENEISLFPEIQPFKTDYLKASDTHEIYYELSGNPDGAPVFGLHDGNGGSSSPYMRRFFDPEKFLIVLHDQRGAGKSKPFAEIRKNTTQHLIEDIETLRTHLNLDKYLKIKNKNCYPVLTPQMTLISQIQNLCHL